MESKGRMLVYMVLGLHFRLLNITSDIWLIIHLSLNWLRGGGDVRPPMLLLDRRNG